MKGSRTRMVLLRAAAVWSLVLSFGATAANWDPDPDSRVQVRAAEAVAKFREKRPKTIPFFDDAYGYAIFPRLWRAGVGLGGAGGKGVVVEQGKVIGETRFGGFTSGVQAGFRSYRMIIFFKDRDALEDYKLGKWQFMGQTHITVATIGASGDPAYNDGVAIFTWARWGLMGEATVGGSKFTFKPLPDSGGSTQSGGKDGSGRMMD